MRSRSFHTRPHFVNTKGRSAVGNSRRSCPTTSSECPSPYTAAVSIQLTPASIAWRIVARDAASSCGPHPNAQPPPPTAHDPKPTRVIFNPLRPRGEVGSDTTCSLKTYRRAARACPRSVDIRRKLSTEATSALVECIRNSLATVMDANRWKSGRVLPATCTGGADVCRASVHPVAADAPLFVIPARSSRGGSVAENGGVLAPAAPRPWSGRTRR